MPSAPSNLNPDSLKILLLRFSAMGDVALLAPIVLGLTQQNPNMTVSIVTRPKFVWFFEGMERVHTIPADVDTIYKGIFGLFKLFLELRKQRFDAVVDLHDHLRTHILGTFFSINGTKVVVFDKGRKEKHLLTQKNNKIRAILPHTTARYAAAFAKLSAHFTIKTSDILAKAPVFQFLKTDAPKIPFAIGFAPFAKHDSKQWGLPNTIRLIDILIETQPQTHVYLFGGGATEIAELEKMKNLLPHHVTVVAGKYTLVAEIDLMQSLQYLICMDSSNLHLAALAGVPTVSIWGATHSDVGFAPFGESRKNLIIQVNTADLPCRPCSVFGDKPCYRGDHACMTRITPEHVANSIKNLFHI